jgi:flagellar biogenesis protein FliO
MQSSRRIRVKSSEATNELSAEVSGTIALAPNAGNSSQPHATAIAPGLKALSLLLRKAFAQFVKLLNRKRRRRKLQLLEMQQLGEKRFVAIMRVGRQKFLIGGAASSVLLLAEIGPNKTTVLAPRPLNQESA